MYSGPEQAPDRVAVLVRGRSLSLLVEEIDGQPAGGEMTERYEVLPGRHEVLVRLDRYNTRRIRFTAQAGHRYRLRLELDRKQDRWRAWAEDAGAPEGPEADVNSLSSRCAGEQHEACVALAAVCEDGFNPVTGWDLVRAVRLYRRACDAGHTPGCVRLGVMYEEGRIGDAADLSVSLFDQACEKGDAEGCNRLATAYLKGRTVPRNEEAAGKYFQASCDGGNVTGCYSLAQLYRLRLTAHLDQAPRLYERACAAGKLVACYQLARLYYEGQAVKLDEARAAALYEQACAGGEPLGCTGLGQLHEEGGWLPMDEARAAALYERACTGGEPLGCANLGTLRTLGLGVARDDAGGGALLRKACRGGVASACNSASILELESKPAAGGGARP